jgi:elongation factor P
VDRTFRAGEKFQRILTSVADMQFLYDDGTDVVMMDTETYEQVALKRAMCEDDLRWLKEGDTVQLLSVDDKPSSLQLPSSVELAVTATEPGVKGDTVSNVMKAATLETGAVVQVPLFVNEGDRVKVDTREGKYISRA